MKQFKVWHDDISDKYWAGWCCRVDESIRWISVGERHDVAADVQQVLAATEALYQEALAEINRLRALVGDAR